MSATTPPSAADSAAAATAGSRPPVWVSYWTDCERLTIRISLLRIFFFGLLGLDVWTNLLPWSPIYGAGGFNVAQLPVLDWLPIPTPAVVLAVRVVTGFLALRTALGISPRISAVGTCIGYFGIYLWTLIDTYQHHYLMGLLLVTFCFLPHESLAGWDRRERPPERVRGWSIRMFHWQLAILYFYAAIAKWDPAWLDGWAMSELMGQNPAVVADSTAMAGWVGLSFRQAATIGAWFAFLAEFFLAAACLWRRLWPAALILGPVLHAGIEFLRLDIEWFSYYMIGFNLIVFMPDAAARRIDGTVRALSDRLRPRLAAARRPLALDAAAAGWNLGLGAVTAGLAWLAVEQWLGLPDAGAAGLLMAAAVLTAHVPRSGGVVVGPASRAVLQLALALAVLVPVRVGGGDVSYYMQWATDLQSRQHYAEAIVRYRQSLRLDPDATRAYAPMAHCYERMGRLEEAEAAFEEALHRSGDDPRARAQIEASLRRVRRVQRAR